MSELKAINTYRLTTNTEDSDVYIHNDKFGCGGDLVECYLKSEVDKVIAEKDKEIQRLENLCRMYRIDCDNLAIREANAYKEIERDNKNLRHHKYKRCLAMAQEWRNYAAFCGMQSSCHNHRGFGKTAEKWTWKECHAWRCRKRWLELAKKFKEA